MAKENHTGRKIAVGAAVAGAFGYLAGLLTAPKSGKETRSDIAAKAGDIVGMAEVELAELQAELKSSITQVKSKAVQLSAKAQAEFNEAIVRAKDAQNKASSVIKAARAGGAQDPELNKAVKQARAATKNLAKYLKS